MSPDSDPSKVAYTLATVAMVGVDHIETMMDVLPVPQALRGALWMAVVRFAMAKVIDCERKADAHE